MDSCPPRYRRQQSLAISSAIAAHPRPVNNETPLASAEHDPNNPSHFPVKLLSVDEEAFAQGPTSTTRTRNTHPLRRSTAMKNPSLPLRAGVRSSVSSLASAEAGGSPPTPATHWRQGNVAKSEWFARKRATWSPFSGSTSSRPRSYAALWRRRSSSSIAHLRERSKSNWSPLVMRAATNSGLDCVGPSRSSFRISIMRQKAATILNWSR